MNLRWLWFDHFPPELGLGEEQRLEARRRASQHRKTNPRFRDTGRRAAITMTVLVVPLTLVFIFWTLHMFWLPWKPTGTAGKVLVNGLGPVLFQGLLWAAIAYGIHRSKVPYFRQALTEMGYPVCIDCGYILRGLDKSALRCPECGAAVGEKVGDAAPHPPTKPVTSSSLVDGPQRRSDQ